MKTKSLLFVMVAAIAMSFIGCKKTTADLTWRTYTTPENTPEAEAVVGEIENALASYYEGLGTYTKGYTDGSAVYSSQVVINGKDYDQIKQKVDDATALADKVLSSGEIDFGTLTQCRVVVTLFVNNCPTEILNKDYIGK